MKVTLKEDIRTLKKGTVYEFDFTERDSILIAGENGCGKSTLINCIRGTVCDNKKKGSGNLEERTLKQLGEDIELEHSFDHIYYLSSEYDDPLSMDTCYDASAFVDNGGFYLKRISNGQRSFGLLNRFLVENFGEDIQIPSNSLIIFDEVDKGFDLKKQVGFHNLLRHLIKRGAKILYVCHAPLPIMLTKEVYVFQLRMFFPSEDYIFLECGKHITVTDEQLPTRGRE